MRVLVVDEGFIGSLHTAIGMRDAGCEVLLAGAVGGKIDHFEAQGFHAVTCPTPNAPEFVSAIEALVDQFGAQVVYPATEPTLLTLSRNRRYTHLVFPRLTEFQLQAIADKRVMLSLAEQAGSFVPSSQPDTFPAVVKATYGRGADAVVVAHTAVQVAAAKERINAAGRCAEVQQYIAGPTYLFGGLFESGNPLRLYAGRKLRQHPREVGPASLIRSECPHELMTSGLKVFRALGWTGIASSDFIRAATGEFYFLEVNPRPWGSIAAAADAGVDLYEPLAQLMAGNSPTAALSFETGVDTHVFPLYLLERSNQVDPRTLLRVRRDLARHTFWRNPRFLIHVARRLARVRANWPDIAASPAPHP